MAYPRFHPRFRSAIPPMVTKIMVSGNNAARILNEAIGPSHWTTCCERRALARLRHFETAPQTKMSLVAGSVDMCPLSEHYRRQISSGLKNMRILNYLDRHICSPLDNRLAADPRVLMHKSQEIPQNAQEDVLATTRSTLDRDLSEPA
jgi:hypothetical protein